MSVVDELKSLAELHQRGHLSAGEYDQAKQHLLRTSRRAVAEASAPPPDGAYLLYRLISSGLRRASMALAVIALLFASVAGWSGVHYFELTSQVAAIQDTSLAHGLGLRIPDPRPAIERAVLQAKASGYGVLAAGTGLVALGSGVGALFVRPPRQ
jgi:hypothetical protein